MKLLALDGNNLVNRAYHATKSEMNKYKAKDGSYTNAIAKFLHILHGLKVREEQPDEVVIAFDVDTPTFRRKMYPDYKAQRESIPKELARQIPVLQGLLGHLGYRVMTYEGYEADDILGTLATASAARGDTCVLVSEDKDILQLVGPNTYVLYPINGGGYKVIDEAAMKKNYGVTPRQWIDVKSLMGDKSDHIPRVYYIGEKTAPLLIKTFGSLEGVYKNIDDPRFDNLPIDTKKVRESLLHHKDQAERNRTLVEIMCNLPIDTTPGAYKPNGPDADAARLMTDLNLTKEMRIFHISAAAPAAPAVPSAETLNLPHVEAKPLTLTALQGTVYICAAGNTMLIVQNDNVYTSVEKDEAFLSLLDNESITKKCFDAKPLYRACLEHRRTAKNIVFDAKLAAYLLDPNPDPGTDKYNYTIAHLAAEYGVTPAFAAEWPEAGLLAGLCETLRTECDKAGMGELLDKIELPLCAVLAEMEHTGFAVDQAGLKLFGKELQTKLDELDKEKDAIRIELGYEVNINKPEQLSKVLFENLGLPPGRKTKNGNYSTEEETINNLLAKTDEATHPTAVRVLKHILQYRTYQSLNSTVKGLLNAIGPDGRVHATFGQTNTRTGRLSAAEPNLQGVPAHSELGKRCRKYLIADPPNMTLLDADYSQIELRLLAHLSGDEDMREAFHNGADIHSSTAAKIYHLAPKDVTDEQRSSAKAVNFGIVYGMGAISLSEKLGVSDAEADEFMKTYFANFPRVEQYLNDTVKQAHKDGYVTTLFGRRRMLPELSSTDYERGERRAKNTPIQGTAADIIKMAMLNVSQPLKKLGARLILQVHDELIVECPNDKVKGAITALSEAMCHAAELTVALEADVNCGHTWYEAKYKHDNAAD